MSDVNDGGAEKGAGVAGGFPELQGAQNIMYEPRGNVPSVSFARNEKWLPVRNNKERQSE